MISELLVSLSRCPVCLEPGREGAAASAPEEVRRVREALSRDGHDRHTTCLEHYSALWKSQNGALVKRKLQPEPSGLRCACCGSLYRWEREKGYLDLRPPPGTFADLTQYAEEELHHGRPGPLRPPFLSARIKIDMMSRMLRLSPSDRVLDIGCGNGRSIFFKRSSCAQLVGIDAGEHFAPEAAATVDLSRGDIRRLPFASASFDKAYALDVLEHLSEDGVRAVLAEARRVLRPGGLFFVYSHVMMSSRLAAFQRAVNRLVRWLDRRGLVDNAPERERKSDHVNALRSYDLLERLLTEAGFEIAQIRYYNVFFKALIEDLLLPLVEHNLYRQSPPPSATDAPRQGRQPPPGPRPDVGSWAHLPLRWATLLMKLDVALFGRVRTGPFFLLLRTASPP